MSSFEEKLAAAKKAEPRSEIVTVSLDPDLAEQRAELQEQIDAAKKAPKDDRLGLKSRIDALKEQLTELQAQELEYLVDLKVTRAPGHEWAAVSAAYPPRADVRVDMHYGFNLHDLTVQEGYRWVTRREGDDWVPFKYAPAGPGKKGSNEFADLCRVLAGGDLSGVVDAMFLLNLWEPQQRRERLGKLRADRQATQSASPSPSESPHDDSADGNPEPSPTTSTTTPAA
jgi:hypothetical protein